MILLLFCNGTVLQSEQLRKAINDSSSKRFSKGYSLLNYMQFLCFSVVLVQFANNVLVKTVWRENGYERERESLTAVFMLVFYGMFAHGNK